MADVKNGSDVKKQVMEFLDRLTDGISRQIVQSEKDLEGFVRVMSEMERELLGLQGVQKNFSLLELLGYSYNDVDDHPQKKVVVGQISYSPDYILKHEHKNLAVIDLKAPDVDLDHMKWLGQIGSYCVHLEAPLGILFNGRSIRIYINVSHRGLSKYKTLFLEQPIAEADNRNQDQLIKILFSISASSLKPNALSIARKLAAERERVIRDQVRRKEIQDKVYYEILMLRYEAI